MTPPPPTIEPPPPDLQPEPEDTAASPRVQPVEAVAGDGAVLVLGVDCAARAGNAGLARAEWRAGTTRLLEVERGRGDAPMVEYAGPRLAEWLAGWDGPVALGLDAPLGWPVPLADALHAHRAGEPLPTPEDPHRLWRRATDVAVQRLTGRTPLEVGADRIARAGKAALDLLHDLRARTGRAFPLTLDAGPPARDCVLEVYPAAVRATHPALPKEGRKTDPDVRLDLATALGGTLALAPALVEALAASDHALDAGLCVLAVAEVLAGRSIPPSRTERVLAEREGWIWVLSPFEGELRGTD